jgi:hypothetical protein
MVEKIHAYSVLVVKSEGTIPLWRLRVDGSINITGFERKKLEGVD